MKKYKNILKLYVGVTCQGFDISRNVTMIFPVMGLLPDT